MFERVLRRLREKVRMGQYVMTVHAEEELDAEDLAVFDVRGRTLDERRSWSL